MNARWALIGASVMLSLPGCASVPKAAVPRGELYRVDEESTILAGARALMLADENAALVTVDADGQPRARTVRTVLEDEDPLRPEKGVTVWIMTRQSTRKVEQILHHPLVTLYYSDDAKLSYATLMGVAIVHTDPFDEEVKRFYDEEYAKFFWPDFPRDFIMIQVRPKWLEFMGPGVRNHPSNWRPQAIEFVR